VNALRVYRHGLLVGYRDFRDFWSLHSWLFGWMLRISTNAFAWVLLGRVIGSQERLEYLLVGNAIATGPAAALWASNATTWARYDGTHPLLVIAPGSLIPAVLGRTSIWLLNGLATSALTFTLLAIAFGFRPASLSGALLVPLVVLVVCASTYFFALFMGALLSTRSRWRNMALDICGMVLLAFCGVSVPVSFWPAWVQVLAELLPVTHGLAAARILLGGGTWHAAWPALAGELCVLSGWLLLGLFTMDRLFNAGRTDGSIELL
jgi:ABC-2 type transport system permease protein